MSFAKIHSHIVYTAIIIVSIILSGCSTPKAGLQNLSGTLYQHQWLLPAMPDKQQDLSTIAEKLSAYDVVFFGELHTHPAIHLAQMELLQAMYQYNANLTLSMEQFEHDTQSDIDDYLVGKTGEKYFMKQARAWDNYPSSYRPLLEYARQQQLPVLAANAPKSAVLCVARKGLAVLDKMPDSERQHIARTIDTSAGEYYDQYMVFLSNNSSHGSSHSSGSKDNASMSKIMQTMAQRSFAAQAVRDDTMAESIARHLQTNPQRQVLHLNGSFHSNGHLGTVERLAKRLPELKIAVISSIAQSDQPEIRDKKQLQQGDVLLLVQELPQAFIQNKHRTSWSREILKKRMANSCPY